MSAIDRSHDWDSSYLDTPAPWDIGRPQPAFARLADAGALTGALLDAGCGTGEHAILAIGHGAHALGVDISPRAIELAKHKAEQREIDVRFQAFDALLVDELGETFDTVIDSGLFHVLDDTERTRYVKALHRALHPSGHLYLMCFSDRQPGDWGPRRVTEVELRSSFGAGWRIASLVPDHFDLNPGLGPTTACAWLADIIRLTSL